MNDLEREALERERKRSSMMAALIGFGTGAIVGAIVALLYAPASGEETRDMIKEKIGDVSDRASDAYSGVKDKVSTAYDSAAEKATSAIGIAKEKFSGKKEE